MQKNQQTLAIIWISGFVVTASILFLQMQAGRYKDYEKEVWSWFLPNIMPTLLLIVGVLVANAVGKTVATTTPNKFLFKITATLSLFYLFLLLVTIVSQLFSATPALELMHNANFLLGPMQGLTAATLGVFFAK